MKVMSVGLISLIIFNIVSAANTSDSGPTTNSSLLLEEKTKKTHKTADEPVNVKGKEPYEEDYEEYYEEDYEDMIKDIFIPLKNNYKYSQNNSHKQDDAPPQVFKGPEKQKFTEKKNFIEKQKLSTINEKDSNYENENDGICQKPKDVSCSDSEEAKQAEELMNEAVEHLEYHATSKDGYEPYGKGFDDILSYYKKKHENHTDVLKAKYKFYDSNQYNDIINMIWDPDYTYLFKVGFNKRKIVRVYNPNLVIIQKRYKRCRLGHEKYLYALAKKTQISEDKTIIAMTSANINDQYPSDKEYKNTIIENANLFKTDIDSEDDIKKGGLKKLFVNIGGYLIEKKNGYVDVTYIESIDGHASF
ncbi:fam-a protein [Plasmodium vinckei brucechwatti]|uniref:Fam-a protein n=1 Tax=Plasmodium vinckei brucechwatti TaxID=119398 RepID=A0A6V7S095_PLAVN|nr:fam-a protein [Plasmodium vinckei brucechwatti]